MCSTAAVQEQQQEQLRHLPTVQLIVCIQIIYTLSAEGSQKDGTVNPKDTHRDRQGESERERVGRNAHRKTGHCYFNSLSNHNMLSTF